MGMILSAKMLSNIFEWDPSRWFKLVTSSRQVLQSVASQQNSCAMLLNNRQ
jgi:hypothetical protein